MEVLFYENNNVKIYYLPEVNSGLARWVGFVSGNNYREALDKAIELYKNKNSSKWIGNLQQMEAITHDDQVWTNEDWFPRAVGAGLKKLGVIVGGDIFNQMSVDQIMSKVESIGLTTQYFDSEQKAIEWMKD